ncbi:MAG TPA: response regulator transcription factor [Chloroflexia bacterium]|nr:response regulator transcription factor [Chloroflexia bacterium]
MSRKVLIIEDDRRIINYLMMYCEAEGWEILTSRDGLEGWRTFNREKPDFVLLDLMLPGLDGLEICRRIRAISDVPVIMITARGEEVDRLLGLEIGADDYVVKPFSPREVVARMRVILRRVERTNGNNRPVSSPIMLGALKIDPASHEVSYGGRTVNDLTGKEFELLVTLARYPGRVYSRTELEEALYDVDSLVGSRAIAAHISNLRAKLVRVGMADPVETVHGIGYKLRKEVH